VNKIITFINSWKENLIPSEFSSDTVQMLYEESVDKTRRGLQQGQ